MAQGARADPDMATTLKEWKRIRWLHVFIYTIQLKIPVNIVTASAGHDVEECAGRAARVPQKADLVRIATEFGCKEKPCSLLTYS
jgi:hypothetical protein